MINFCLRISWVSKNWLKKVSLRFSSGNGPVKSNWISLFGSRIVGNCDKMFLGIIDFMSLPIFMQCGQPWGRVIVSLCILGNQIIFAKSIMPVWPGTFLWMSFLNCLGMYYFTSLRYILTEWCLNLAEGSSSKGFNVLKYPNFFFQ